MHAILLQLKTDHKNAAQLLTLFRSEVAQLESQLDSPDYHKWQNILQYMTTYQDIFHHPTEEIIFNQLKLNSSELTNKIEEVERQHQTLYQLSRQLLKLLGLLETEFLELNKQELVAQCYSYINLLTEHMNLEESNIFAFANEFMTEADWAVVESRVKHIDDPIFSETRKQEFENLYQWIYNQ